MPLATPSILGGGFIVLEPPNDQHPVGRSPGKDGRLLARRQLPVGRADLPARQPAARRAARAASTSSRACSAIGARPRAELHLRASQPADHRARSQHDLHHRPRPWRPGHGRATPISKARYTELYPAIERSRERHAAAVPPVLVARRHSQPRRAGDAGLDPRRRRTRLFARACLRRRVRQSRSDRRLRRRRRRGGDRPARRELAFEQVPESRRATARCCRSCI